jgi:hypothetical protein
MLITEIAAWEQRRNAEEARITWPLPSTVLARSSVDSTRSRLIVLRLPRESVKITAPRY